MSSVLASLVVTLLVAGPACPEPLYVAVPPAVPDTFPKLYEGVGEGPHSRLRFFFEVTFMKIDIDVHEPRRSTRVHRFIHMPRGSIQREAHPIGVGYLTALNRPRQHRGQMPTSAAPAE